MESRINIQGDIIQKMIIERGSIDICGGNWDCSAIISIDWVKWIIWFPYTDLPSQNLYFFIKLTKWILHWGILLHLSNH